MKKALEMCSVCREETWHMIGKKQGHSRDRWHTRRTTSECTKCGKKEINNRENGKRIISRKNTQAKQELKIPKEKRGFGRSYGYPTPNKQEASQVKG